MMRKHTILLLLLLVMGCVGIPENVAPVGNFDVERYLGKWYEIARLDHAFERGLSRVTAEYGLRDDGGIRVLNRGYSREEDAWKTAEGKAYFVEGSDLGYLKVSFFGPFYGAYVIVELDRERYQYALVCGPNKSYLWILARSPHLSSEITDRLLQKASDLGFDTSELIYVNHERPAP